MSNEVKKPAEDVAKNAIAAKIQCLAGRLHGDGATLAVDTTACNIVADMESGTVTFNIPEKDFVFAARFDELLQVMAEGIVLSHQIHDGEEAVGDGIQ